MEKNNHPSPLFSGVATALVTPFKNGMPDFEALGRLIDLQIESGVSALVICGTTGEGSTLTEKERGYLIRYAVSRVGGRVPLIAGTGSNDTARAVRYSKEAAAAGADALLVVTPYYNKGTREGLRTHYFSVAEAAKLPTIVYNVPARTGVSLTEEDYDDLFRHSGLVGVKEASGSLALASFLSSREIPFWAGNDSETLPFLSLGAGGVISVLSNLFPKETVEVCRLFQMGNVTEARKRHLRLLPLCRLLFQEVNPVPVKYAMFLQGLCEPDVRLPLTRPSERTARDLCRALSALAEEHE